MVKLPFSNRHDAAEREKFVALREGIPEGLRPTLLDWSSASFAQHLPMREKRVDRDKLGYAEILTNRNILSGGYRNSLPHLVDALSMDDKLHLDVIDIALGWVEDDAATLLEIYLRDSRSAYCVATDGDGTRVLQHRQPKELSELFDCEANQPGRAAKHLRTAWSKCFGLNPDTKGACIEAVSAIEVAGKPVVSPKNSKTTLGTICRDIRSAPDKWETDSEAVSSVQTVLGMMQMVWNEGHYRHGDESAPLDVTQEAAEMTVQTAMLLVTWFRSGRIRVKAQPL